MTDMWMWLKAMLGFSPSHTVSMESARERVARGASYLDKVDPTWYRSVDPVTLELSDGSHCVLGQMHGDYRLGLGRSHLLNMGSGPRPSLSPVAHGFQALDTESDADTAHDYDFLTTAWAEAVRKRHAEDDALDYSGSSYMSSQA